MKKVIEKPFTLYLSNEEEGKDFAECVLHSYELFDNADSDCLGYMKITIADQEPFDYAIWGLEKDYSDAYLCLPTMLTESEEDELEVISLDEMLDGME